MFRLAFGLLLLFGAMGNHFALVGTWGSETLSYCGAVLATWGVFHLIFNRRNDPQTPASLEYGTDSTHRATAA